MTTNSTRKDFRSLICDGKNNDEERPYGAKETFKKGFLHVYENVWMLCGF